MGGPWPAASCNGVGSVWLIWSCCWAPGRTATYLVSRETRLAARLRLWGPSETGTEDRSGRRLLGLGSQRPGGQ